MRKNVYTLFSVCLILFIGIESYAQTIIRGPYLQMGTPNSMVIKWRTNSATSSKVWYGSNSSNLPFTVTDNGNRTEHEVTITGLAPNSTYYYAVGNTSGQLTQPSNNHYFKTSPIPGTAQTIRTWVLGDCGTGDNNQRAVRDAFYNFNGAQHIDMILMLGDNAYEDGTDSEFQAALFENMYEDRLINTVMWPAIGNHEIVSASSPDESGPYYDIFTLPRNGEAGGVPSGTEAYYSFDYGNIHCVVLDSDDTPKDPGDPMLVWLENDLSSTSQDWIVAYWHHPPYSKGGGSDTGAKETDMRENVNPILENYGVDLVLVGHSHNWQRSYLIHGHYGQSNSWNPNTMGIDLGDGRLDGDGAYTKNANGEGTVYIVSGSAGKRGGTISPNEFHPVMYESISDYGSMYMEVTGGQMDIKFIRDNGVIHDYLTIMKQVATGFPPDVSVTAPDHGTNYTTPQAITITADASDSDGSVTQVEFFVNNISIGTDYQAPYSVNYTIPDEGTYNITANAIDNDDNTTQSSVVQFTVGPVTTCVRVTDGNDDAEERPSGTVNLTSGDLELVDDGGLGSQVVGIRFNGLNIPQGANIASAYLQFTADENTNDNPCTITIFGQDSDNAGPFNSQDFSISGLPKTSNSVSWTPSDWLAIGDSGPAQQSPNITSIIQEIVSRPGFSANSSIALVLQGMGRRTAESYDGSTSYAPELCIEWSMAPIAFDCPNIPANIGTPCDDGDNTTLNDMIDANCNCT
ncbi:MAG: metallophosphoesterase, partial [Phaeodactylibacter sp.]|nr:metallophosphoesterase [Phaeodactylibacter sp.]